MITKKIYYDNPFLISINSVITEIKDFSIILDETVSFPEGGGQIGDSGVITILNNGIKIPYADTQKQMGRTIFLKDFPTIQVEGKIAHILLNNDDLNKVKMGDKVNISINKEKRAGATVHHSALHLALMILEQEQPDIDRKITGCKITDVYGRLDFKTNHKLTQEELLIIENKFNLAVKNNLDFFTFSHNNEKEAIYWQCKDYIIPCGGTHVSHSSDLGKGKITRKSIGKGKDRLIVKIPTINESFLNKYE